MAANDVPCCQTMFWVYLCICVALVCFAGLMSGLTLGLMSLSLVDLEVLAKSGKPQDRENAVKILPLVKNQHLLLCTLLIYNAMAMEALPIFLDSILPAWISILISVTLILAFGEIIPQAVCSRYGLSVGAKLAVVVRLLVVVMMPLSYPISKLLDLVLGKGHSALLRRAELKAFVDLHGNEAGKGGELTHDETTIIGGALELAQKTAKGAMTPMCRVFSLDVNAKLDKETLELIMRKGHSRVPIYSGNPTNIIGIILVKGLIVCQPEDETPIRNLTIRRIPRFHENQPLYGILNQFQRGNSHMGVVVKRKQQALKSLDEISSNPSKYEVSVNMNGNHELLQTRGQNDRLCAEDQKNPCRKPCVVCCSEAQPPPLLNDAIEQCTGQCRHPRGVLEGDEPDSSANSNEEVVGIITMEDVMEELLQEEILDETDEYIDLHNRIAVNMQPTSMLSPRSPGFASGSHPCRRSPLASPISPYHNASPASFYRHAASPIARTGLFTSPSAGSPAQAYLRTTQSPQRVSRKSYEKMRRSGDS